MRLAMPNATVRWLAAALGLILLPYLLKAGWIGWQIHTYTTEPFHFALLQVLAGDSPLIACLLCLALLSAALPGRVAPALAALCAIGASLLYVADVVLILHFQARLNILDVLEYGAHALDFARDTVRATKVVGVCLAAAGYLLAAQQLLFARRGLNRKRALSVLAGCLLLVLPLGMLKDAKQYLHAHIYQNLAEYTWMVRGLNAPYSQEFLAKLRARPVEDHAVAWKGEAARPDIILLVVESLSSYHSRLFSGLADLTPELDRIAGENLAFSDFSANGYCTNDGMISLLTGELPLAPPALAARSLRVELGFENVMGLPHALPRLAAQRGYRTDYLTSGDTAFSEFAPWGRSIGFGLIEGNEHYAGKPRYTLGAVDDAHLFARSLERLKGQGPVLQVLMTTGTHQPYYVPERDAFSEFAAVARMDAQVGRYYEALKSAGFFENGVLLIVGDHRAMTPVGAAEAALFGPQRAPARIPLIVCDGKHRGMVGLGFQQADVYRSLANLISEDKRVSDWQGDLLADPPMPPRFILHKRGAVRNELYIYTTGQARTVRLFGDDTDLVDQGGLPDGSVDRQAILDTVNRARTRSLP